MEFQSPFAATARKRLQNLETAWRQDGVLVHCDSSREGIWRFQSAISNTTDPQSGKPTFIETPIIEGPGIGLLLKEKGLYEPASLGPSRMTAGNDLSTSSVNSSPSSSLESTIRNAQSFNAKAVQANANQSSSSEPPTPSSGSKSSTLAESWPVLRDIHECFISAALESIVFFLCRDHSFIPLNSRTLIFPAPNFRSDMRTDNLIYGTDTITLATLDISLTSLGTVIIKAHSDIAPGLQSLSNSLGCSSMPLSGTPLWLAPAGNAAKYYGSQDDKNLPGTLPISHLQTNPPEHPMHGINGITIQSWKFKCLDWLSAKGLNASALDAGGWIFVQVQGGNSPYLTADHPEIYMLDDLSIVPWPTLLCFQTAGQGSRELQSLTMNPLSFAEEWFVTRDERIALLARRQTERQAADAKSREQADADARAMQSIIHSPAAFRRGSNAGAMYPTPPDAVHNPIGATPTFDGTVSTPGNPNGLFSHDIDPRPLHTNSENTNAEADLWESTGKKDRAITNLNFDDNVNDSDNLFNDSVEDMFGDITDADFNFFDGPDAVPADQAITSQEEAVLETQETVNTMPVVMNHATGADASGEVITDIRHSVDAHTTTPDNDTTSENVVNTAPDLLQSDMEQTSETMEHLQPMSTPPFDMESVFRRVVQESPGRKRSEKGGDEHRRASVFDKVGFETSLLSVDEKYSAQGRFAFSDDIESLPKVESLTLPKVKSFSRQRKAANIEQVSHNLVRLFDADSNVVNIKTNGDEEISYPADSDVASQSSEQDDSSCTTDDPSLMLKPGVKRKWTMDDGYGEEMSSSFNALAVEFPQAAGTPLSISGSQIPLLEGDSADWPLITYFTSPEPEMHSSILSDLECIATAQILADQAVSGTLKIPGCIESTGSEASTPSHQSSSTRELMYAIAKAAESCFKNIATCTLQSYLEIQGTPILNQAHRLTPRPVPNSKTAHMLDTSRLNNPFSIHPPQLEVQRSETKLSIQPSAIHFWENLGLSPSQGSKDISAVCVYPNFDGVAESASTFLEQMRSTYESSRLGSHERLTSKDLPDSLIPFSVDSDHPSSKIQYSLALKETTAKLSRVLSSLPVEEKNFVVYFVYPVDNPALLVQICSAFQHLFNLYRKYLSERKSRTANELVLQLIPLDCIASPMSIVVPWPSEYWRLAMEVYDRCIDFVSYSSLPAILLEQPLPKNIDFKLNANPSASLLQENSCLHIAYAQSIDDRWITAAWTDNRGTRQMTASYCLGRKNEPLSTHFSDVAHEIWETTLDIIASKKVHWRIMIARVGVMDPSELEFWTGLAATESNARVNLTLITVQTQPSLRLLPPSISLPPISNANQAVITPVSTPQATSTTSPDTASTPVRDNNNNAATPGETSVEPEDDARLIDYTDQSWGAVIAHRLNNSYSLLEINPALISGFLIKRGGIKFDPLIIMEVNIIHSEVTGNPRIFHEALLREILGYYRGLGTLARVRGVVDAVEDVRPWHIAAAQKAVKALYMLM